MRKQKTVASDMKAALSQPSIDRLRRALADARSCGLADSLAHKEILREAQDTLKRLEMQETDRIRAKELLVEAMGLSNSEKSVKKRKELLREALREAKCAGLSKDSELVSDVESALAKYSWKASIKTVLHMNRALKKKNASVEIDDKIDRASLVSELSRNLQDAMALKDADARLAALRLAVNDAKEHIVDEVELSGISSFAQGLKAMTALEHEIERRDTCLKGLRLGVTSRDLQTLQLAISQAKDGGFVELSNDVLRDAEDVVVELKAKRVREDEAKLTLRHAIETCSLVDLKNAILEAEEQGLAPTLDVLKDAKTLSNDLSHIEMEYNSAESDLKNAIELKSTDLLKRALSKMARLDEKTKDVIGSFHFDPNVFSHQVETLTSKARVVAIKAKTCLKTLELQSNVRSQSIDALQTAMKKHDFKHIEECMQLCLSNGVDPSELKIANKVLVDMKKKDESRKHVFQLLEHAVTHKSLDMLIPAIRAANNVDMSSRPELLTRANELKAMIEYEVKERNDALHELRAITENTPLNLVTCKLKRAKLAGVNKENATMRRAEAIQAQQASKERFRLAELERVRHRNEVVVMKTQLEELEMMHGASVLSSQVGMGLVTHLSTGLARSKGHIAQTKKPFKFGWLEAKTPVLDTRRIQIAGGVGGTLEQLSVCMPMEMNKDKLRTFGLVDPMDDNFSDSDADSPQVYDVTGERAELSRREPSTTLSTASTPHPTNIRSSPAVRASVSTPTGSTRATSRWSPPLSTLNVRQDDTKTQSPVVDEPPDRPEDGDSDATTQKDDTTAPVFSDDNVSQYVDRLWNIFTFYNVKFSPRDPYHMTPNSAVSFVRDCCRSRDRDVRSSRSSEHPASCGPLTPSTTKSWVYVMSKAILSVGSTGRLMFGDFIRLVGCLSAPCQRYGRRIHICRRCSLQGIERCNMESVLTARLAHQSLWTRDTTRIRHFCAFCDDVIFPSARRRSPCVLPRLSSHFSTFSTLTTPSTMRLLGDCGGGDVVRILLRLFVRHSRKRENALFRRETQTKSLFVDGSNSTDGRLMHWEDFYTICELLQLHTSSLLTVRDVADSYLSSTILVINASERFRDHQKFRPVKPVTGMAPSRCRRVMLYALTAHGFFECMLRLSLVLLTRQDPSTPLSWNVLDDPARLERRARAIDRDDSFVFQDAMIPILGALVGSRPVRSATDARKTDHPHTIVTIPSIELRNRLVMSIAKLLGEWVIRRNERSRKRGR